MFVKELFSDPGNYVLWVAVVMFSICCHEFAHAYVALRQGDHTAAEAGHLTLNPMVQMGPLAIGVLLLFGIAWGMVPVSPWRLRHKYSHALVAFAGPATNLLLFLAFAGLLAVTITFGRHAAAGDSDRVLAGFMQLFWTGAVLNIVLFCFNLLPAPILDGWVVITYFFPRLEQVPQEARNASIFIILVGVGWFGAATLFRFGYLLTTTAVQGLAVPLAGLARLFGVG